MGDQELLQLSDQELLDWLSQRSHRIESQWDQTVGWTVRVIVTGTAAGFRPALQDAVRQMQAQLARS